MNKTGTLQAKRRLPGWCRDLEITVDGEKFYKRNSNQAEKDEIETDFNVGDRVNVEYEEARTGLTDLIVDRVLRWGCVPRNYREIVKVFKVD